MSNTQTTSANVRYAYMMCPYCSPFTIYPAWAISCQKCGRPLEQCDLPYDPTDKENRLKNLEFMAHWWKEHHKFGIEIIPEQKDVK